MSGFMSAAEWAEFQAFIAACNEPSTEAQAPACEEGGPVRPFYTPSTIVFEADQPARTMMVLTPVERRFVGTPVDHRQEVHPEQRRNRLAQVMRERASACV